VRLPFALPISPTQLRTAANRRPGGRSRSVCHVAGTPLRSFSDNCRGVHPVPRRAAPNTQPRRVSRLVLSRSSSCCPRPIGFECENDARRKCSPLHGTQPLRQAPLSTRNSAGSTGPSSCAADNRVPTDNRPAPGRSTRMGSNRDCSTG